MNEFQSQIYEFGEFRVDVSKRLLIKGIDEVVPLTPKVFDTLLYLVRHNGKVIEKDELMQAIWTDSIVEENNLNQNISVLRRVFGEKPGEHRFIITVAGHGYRFVPEVRERSEMPVSSDKLNLSESSAAAGGLTSPELQNSDDRLQVENQSEIANLKSEITANPNTENRIAKDKEQKTKDKKPSRFRFATIIGVLINLSLE